MNILRKIVCLTCLLFVASCGGSGGGEGEAVGDDGGAIGAFSKVLSTCGREGGPLTILNLGDSITESKRGYNSYRRSLWHSLAAAGCVVDFVGTRRGVSEGVRHTPGITPRNPDFDLDHEGRWGMRIDEILPSIPSLISSIYPDIVLIHLGTNDIFQGQSIQGTAEELGILIDSIRAYRPDVAIVISKVIPSSRSRSRLQALNDSIDGIVFPRISGFSALLVVDQSQGYFVSDNFDGTHPGDSGEVKLADKFANAVLQLSANSI